MVFQQCPLSIVMVIFICQPGGVMASRYLVKHYSRHLCESIFWMGLTFQSVNLSKLHCSLWCGWALHTQLKALRKRLTSPKRKFCQPEVLKLQLQLFPGNLTCWPNLQSVHLPTLRNHMSQLLNKNTGFLAGSVSLKNFNISIYHVPGIIRNSWCLQGVQKK